LHCWGGFVVVSLALAASADAQQLAVDGSGRAFVVRTTASAVWLRSAAPGARFGTWRTVVGAGRGERVMDAGVATDGRGVAVVETARGLRMVTFGGKVVGSARGDFAASAVAPSGAAVVVTFRHRRDRRWRLEASVREPGARAFGAAQPLTRFIRRACCTSVSAAIGARGDAALTWSSTVRPSVWATTRARGGRFGRAQRLTASAASAPSAVVGANGTSAVTYSTQHVPLRASDGLQLHRSSGASRFGPAEHVDPGGGVTTGSVAIAPSGAITVAWIGGAHVHLSRAPTNGTLVPAAELGTDVSPRSLAVDADDSGRTVVAWAERAGARERATAAIEPATAAAFGAPHELGRPWRAVAPVEARLVPGGAVVLSTGRPTARRSALAVARLP
jgi:hypothetical protein